MLLPAGAHSFFVLCVPRSWHHLVGDFDLSWQQTLKKDSVWGREGLEEIRDFNMRQRSDNKNPDQKEGG